MKRSTAMLGIVGLALSLGASLSPCSAQEIETTLNGKKIIIPESSIPRPGRINTNYFFVGSSEPAARPAVGDETPGSLACVYKLVPGPKGCPVA
ncbi:MAG: hypothetical protein LAO09_12280, partial [Acidobacteriia bacterium]|nr:hypothetical protein [Terriglobia bacterium]